MTASVNTGKNAPSFGASFVEISPDQLQQLSPVTARSIYPALESLGPVLRDRSAMPTTSGGFDNPGSSASLSDSQDRPGQRSETSGSPGASPRTGPSVISRHELPTYRQASMSEEGISPSGYPSVGSESLPYHMDSSLPDILYSHMVPRVPPARPNQHRQQRHRSRQEAGPSGGSRHRQRTSGGRSGRHRRTSSWNRSTPSSQTQEGSCKEPCVKCVVTITSFRWVLVALSVLGVFCVVTGIVLAALHASGDSFLFLAIMFIGLGVLLVIVVGVGWKCTPRGHEPLHALFGIGGFRHGQSRARRHRRHRNRDGNWFGGVLYPEFQYRRPPPSYAASMLDYQSQVVTQHDETLDRRDSVQGIGDSLPNSPPPSYRSRTSTTHSGILSAFPHIQDTEQASSRPPTYRSRAPSRRPSLPLEYHVELGISEIEMDESPPQSIESSSRLISYDGSHAGRSAASTSSSSPFSQLPVAGSAVRESWSGCLPESKYKHATLLAMASQPHAVPSRRTVQTDNQISTVLTQNTLSLTSDPSASASSSSSSSHGGVFPSSSQSCAGSHQRMPSEDRQVLEQTLQSLEEHMDEGGGIANEGASVDEQDPATD